MSTLKIGLFGCGCVGGGLYEVLNQTRQLPAVIHKIVVKDPSKKRQVPSSLISFHKEEILDDPAIDIVVELINDSDAAYHIVCDALKKGKHVVSANKKLIAEHLDELILLAKSNGVSFLYEGAVGGSIPVIRNLEEYYNNDTLSSIEGIINGTTNFILTKGNEGIGYAEALAEAQLKGFAEADPTLDVDGFDAKFKLVLLLKHAFGLTTTPDEVFNTGIRHIKQQDIAFAREKGYRIKLIGHGHKLPSGVAGFVAPQFIKNQHPAYFVDNEFNAIIVQAAFADKQLFIGKGAGSFPTASAVLSDISAIQYQYQYEYRKSDTPTNKLTPDFHLHAYIGSASLDDVHSVPMDVTDSVFSSKEYSYKTGQISFQQLRKTDWLEQKQLSLILLPQGIVS
ncbi:MAG: homoserine dehydrogenase [Saprospiraceae bacterium]|jgi:homoserine dehydrogenase|nr:homoserine dehydrogenase [Saprospiraceae bacterium]